VIVFVNVSVEVFVGEGVNEPVEVGDAVSV